MLLDLFWLFCNAARHLAAPDVSYGRISVLLGRCSTKDRYFWFPHRSFTMTKKCTSKVFLSAAGRDFRKATVVFYGARARTTRTRSTTKALSASHLFDELKLQLPERLPRFCRK
ncbi:unnamed protein product [Amoebophrya sp. A120]|nr:unnamed protein product [Amoebophrya sp. A120]|eukprot:GSA120T00012302001.1